WLGGRGVLSELGIEPLGCLRRASGTARSRVCQTLVRTAQDFAAAGRDEPVRWLESLSRATDTDLRAVMAIAAELPHQTLVLRELAADLARQMVVQTRARFAEPAEADADGLGQAILASSLLVLGMRISAIGRREEALDVSREATDIYRRLVQNRLDAFLPDF